MPYGDNIITEIFPEDYSNTLEKQCKIALTDLMADMLGTYSGYVAGSTETYSGTFLNTTGGYLRTSGGLDDTTPHLLPSGLESLTELEYTWNAYEEALSTLYTIINSYFETSSNNNNNLTDINSDGKPIGRAGYFSRYADAHYLARSYYATKAYILWDDTEVPIISSSYYDIADFPNLFDYYINTILSAIFSETAANLFVECGYYKWYTTPSPAHWGDPVTTPIEVTFDDTYISTTLASIFDYTNEEPHLQTLVGTAEDRVSIINSTELKNLFSILNVVGAAGGTIINRDYSDTDTYPVNDYPDIETFYINKQIYDVIFSFYNLDYLYPRKIKRG